jgi:hypothetical protein
MSTFFAIKLYEGSSLPSVSFAEHPLQQNTEEDENIIQIANTMLEMEKFVSTSSSCIRESGSITQ